MTTPESRRGKRSPLVWLVIGLSVSLCGFTALLLFLVLKNPRPASISASRDVAAESNPNELEPVVAVTEKDFPTSNVVSAVLGEESEDDGVKHLARESDGRTTLTNIDGVACRYLDRRPRSFGYVYYAIAPTFKGNELNAARIEIEYRAHHSGVLRLQFDAMEPERHRPYKTAAPVSGQQTSLGDVQGFLRLRASNGWQTATFYATNGNFMNSQNGGADFRLEVTPSEIYLRRVTVTRVEGIAPH
ncbi:MAG TPA: hypothetical protein VNT99_16660 [Methylomirabilota bacterium]|nr:hypothetical protein [Methylomirabilota bacterium]